MENNKMFSERVLQTETDSELNDVNSSGLDSEEDSDCDSIGSMY